MSRYSVLSRRHRLLPAALAVCALTLGYFCWFTSYRRSYKSVAMIGFEDSGPTSNSSSRPTLSEATATKPQKRVLLVSAFYPLPKSKHTSAEYTDWLQRFLGHVSTDIYFFTTPEMEPHVRRARDTLSSKVSSGSGSTASSHTPQLIMNTTYPSPFSIPPLHPFKGKYEEMHAWDREKDRHSPDLYAIWNAKPWFLKEGLRNMRLHNFGDYDYAFWTDAGSFRHEHSYEAWPDAARVEEVLEAGFQIQIEQWKAWDAMRDGTQEGHREWDAIQKKEKGRKAEVSSKEDLFFFPVYELPGKEELGWKEELGPIDIEFSEGTFFGASPNAISWYTDLFYAYHDHYISTPPPSSTPAPAHPHTPAAPNATYPPFHFVGKDQTIINALFFLHPHRFITVISPSHLQSPPPISTSGQAKDWTWALNAFKTTANNKLWEVLRGSSEGVCGDEWFYYQYFVAGSGERSVMRGVWNAGLGWVEALLRGSGTGEGKGNGEGGRQEEQGCPLSQVMTIEGVLRGLFGVRWEIPRGSVNVGR